MARTPVRGLARRHILLVDFGMQELDWRAAYLAQPLQVAGAKLLICRRQCWLPQSARTETFGCDNAIRNGAEVRHLVANVDSVLPTHHVLEPDVDPVLLGFDAQRHSLAAY